MLVVLLRGLSREEVVVPAFPDISLPLGGVVLCVREAEGVSSLFRASTAFFTMSSLLSLLSLLSLPFSRSDGEGK